MADEDIGWFKVSRRIRKSSIWWKAPLPTFKVLMFLLDEAQAFDNPYPGEIHMGPTVIAGCCGLEVGLVEEALKRLCEEDEESQTREDKRTLEPLEQGGGYRLVNFEAYNPGMAEKRGMQAVVRRAKAKKAAQARWRKDEQEEGPEDLPTTPHETPSPASVAVVEQLPAKVAKERKETLVSRGCDIWNAKYGPGSADGGRIAAALTPLAKHNPEEVVLAALQRYTLETTHPSPSPQDFKSHFADWLPGGKGAGRTGIKAVVRDVTEENRQALREIQKEREGK